MTAARLYRNGAIFDGARLHSDGALRVEAGAITALGAAAEVTAAGAEEVDLAGDVLSPGFVDLQVNGGGGVMFNDAPTVAGLRAIAAAHARLGATTILPTLISDTTDRTRAAIAAVRAAVAEGVPGIAGLHLEGPHLAPARAGAHDPAVIRPMTETDLATLTDAARRLPALMVTLAPESATPAQVEGLVRAGAVVSLGHTEADFDTCMAYAAAGATCVTHLFNAMSQLGSRVPGLVGAALAHGGLSAGLIADGVHVHPATMRAAVAAKAGPGALFLVSDAMAVAGTELMGCHLNGRWIARGGGRLTLGDGTLAGADLDLATAVGVMVTEVGVPLEAALRMATRAPARAVGLPAPAGRLAPGPAPALLRLTLRDGRPVLREVIDPRAAP